MAIIDQPHVFYAPDLEKESGFLDLGKEEAEHIRKVLRIKSGDVVYLTNGRGLKAKARLIQNEKNRCSVEVISTEILYKGDARLHLAVSPTKNHDRYEWFVEKAVELGVDTITPLICRHSERKTVHRERLMRIMVAALKQSGTCFLPELREAQEMESLMERADFGVGRFIAWCGSDQDPHLFNALRARISACVLVGPEGDFTEDEVALAKKKDFLPISLGNSRLRTETAGVVACQIFNLKNQI